MGIFDSILRSKSGAPQGLSDLLENLDLENLPEPPAEIKEMLKGLTAKVQAAIAGQPCPVCGEVHENPFSAFAIPLSKLTNDGPEVPEYEASNGLSGEYVYAPKPIDAIQFLPNNVGDVMAFLVRHEIPFGYTLKGGTEHRILLVSINGADTDIDTDELVYGKWAVVTGSRADRDLAYSAITDENFRGTFQPKVHENHAASTGELDLEAEADSFLEDAKNGALDAYGEPAE
jgi:hypothetical protein